jgi:hypothetical protein
MEWTTPHVVDFSATGISKEMDEKLSDIIGVDLVANLLALVPENRVAAPLNGAAYDVVQVPVKFDTRVLRTRKTAAAKNSYRHLKVTPEFLAEHVSRELGSSEE